MHTIAPQHPREFSFPCFRTQSPIYVLLRFATPQRLYRPGQLDAVARHRDILESCLAGDQARACRGTDVELCRENIQVSSSVHRVVLSQLTFA
jgi:hypothetical protein